MADSWRAVPFGGVCDGGLEMTVLVNTERVDEGPGPLIRSGDEVGVRYRLTNHGRTDLDDIHVDDPSLPGGSIDCAAHVLPARRSVECTAQFGSGASGLTGCGVVGDQLASGP